MPVIEVANRFMLQIDYDTPLVEYQPGRYEVSDEVAEHWYVKMNLVGAKPWENAAMTAAQKTLLVEQAVRMAEPVSDQGGQLPEAPPGTIPAGRAEHFFAGTPQSEEAKATSNLSLARGPRK